GVDADPDPAILGGVLARGHRLRGHTAPCCCVLGCWAAFRTTVPLLGDRSTITPVYRRFNPEPARTPTAEIALVPQNPLAVLASPPAFGTGANAAAASH